MTIRELFAGREKLLAFCKKNKWILLTGALGLLLLCLPVGGKTETPPVIAETEEEVFSAEAFEQRLETILSEIDGAGRVRVMLTLGSSTETVYASDVTEHNRTRGDESERQLEESIVFSAQSGSTAAVERVRIYPKFSGAIVVCDGADKASVKLMVISAVSAATGLSSEKISVLPGK